MEVREGRPEDTETIRGVATAAWHAAYDGILGAETVDERIDEWYAPDVVHDYFGMDDVSVFVAGDPIAGYAFCRWTDPDRLHLTAIYVHPDRWGEGIGSRLLDRVEREAREGDAEAVDLVVLAENEIGRSFYETHGYERVDEREEPVDDARELVYEKQLKG